MARFSLILAMLQLTHFGSLMQKITASRNLSYFAYGIGEISSDFTCHSQSELNENCKIWIYLSQTLCFLWKS